MITNFLSVQKAYYLMGHSVVVIKLIVGMKVTTIPLPTNVQIFQAFAETRKPLRQYAVITVTVKLSTKVITFAIVWITGLAMNVLNLTPVIPVRVSAVENDFLIFSRNHSQKFGIIVSHYFYPVGLI